MIFLAIGALIGYLVGGDALHTLYGAATAYVCLALVGLFGDAS